MVSQNDAIMCVFAKERSHLDGPRKDSVILEDFWL